MHILINSDDQICCDAELMRRIEGVVEGSLERFAGRITRVEVALSDLNSSQVGDHDKCCVMEARLNGLKPVAVSHEAQTLAEAIHGAADQLRRSLDDYLRAAAPSEGPPLPVLGPHPVDQDA
ncbi:MAG TPA: HPF/RaiA family ribosome-associated protein [Steroidobacteraceae bacterium]|jgi:hypothetical protein